MKKSVISFMAIIFGNFLCAKFWHTQSGLRFLSLLGLFMVLASIFSFSANFSRLFRSSDEQSISEEKSVTVMAIVLAILIVLQVLGMVLFDTYQNKLLEEHGQFTETIVLNKTWERRGRGASGYYIHYIFAYQWEGL